MINIVIDNIIFYWQKSGGISVVAFELIRRALNRCQMFNIMFIEYENSLDNKFRKRLEIPRDSIIKICAKRTMFFKRYLPLKIKIKKPFIYHSSYYRFCKNKNAINVVTVHDFTYEYFMHGLSKYIHCITKHRAIRKADYIICISNNTKIDLLKFIKNIDEDKIFVVYNGVGDAFFPLEQKYRYVDNDEKYLVFIGAREGYKNFNIAVETAKIVGMKLVIVGKKLCRREILLVKNLIGDNYSDMGFINDDALNHIYNKAFALIYPSAYEGFGIPVIEAQKAGCPVVAMNKSSIPEIIGNKELLVDSEDCQEFATKLNMLRNSEFRNKIIEEGLLNSLRFSWNKTFKQYEKIYSSIFNTKN